MTRSEVDRPRDEQSPRAIPAPPVTDRRLGRTPSGAFRSHVRSRLPCRPVSPHQARSRAVPPPISRGRWPYGRGDLQVARAPQARDGDSDEPQANHGSPTQPSPHARRPPALRGRLRGHGVGRHRGTPSPARSAGEGRHADLSREMWRGQAKGISAKEGKRDHRRVRHRLRPDLQPRPLNQQLEHRAEAASTGSATCVIVCTILHRFVNKNVCLRSGSHTDKRSASPVSTSRSWVSRSDNACPSAPNTRLMSLGSVDIFSLSHCAHAFDRRHARWPRSDK
jgi:hypothetical protein